MRTILGLATAGVVCFAAAAGAQGYGGGGMGGGGMGGGMGGGGMGRHGGGGYSGSGDNGDKKLGEQIRAFNPDNPISLIIYSRKDLKLSDSQVVALHVMGDSLRAKNAPLRAHMDSLRLGAAAGQNLNLDALTPAERDSVLDVRKSIAMTMGQIHDNATQTRTAALALMTEKQQAKFAEIEERVLNARPQDSGRRGGWGAGGSGGQGGVGTGNGGGSPPSDGSGSPPN